MSINVLFPVSSNNTKLTIFRSHLTLPKEDWVAGKCQKKKKKKKVFNRRHKIIQVWNNMSKWWQNVNFWVIPVRVFSIINHTDVFFFVCVIMTGWLYIILLTKYINGLIIRAEIILLWESSLYGECRFNLHMK